MWYTLPESNKQYPLTIQRVKEIKRLNAQGQKAQELQPVELVSNKPKEVEHEFVDVVGHISLRSLERNSKKRKDKEFQQRTEVKEPKEKETKNLQSQQGNQQQKNQQQKKPQQRPPFNRPPQQKPPQQRPPQQKK